MKNLHLLLIVLLTTFNLSAQPTITDAIAPNIGDSWEVTFLELNNFDPGPSGAMQSWDFSSLDLSNVLKLDFKVLHPATVLGNSNFPNAAFVWHLSAFEIYEFYSVEQDSISLVGGVNASNNEINFLTIFTNPEDGLHLPLTYGDSYPYNSTFEQYFSGSLLGTYGRTGNVSADAYGSLKTPDGTYNDVLRVKITETSFGFTSTQYAWYDVNNFTPIMVYESSDDPDSPPSLYFSKPNILSPTAEISQSEMAWKAWVDRSENKIKVELPAASTAQPAKLQIFNKEGKMLSDHQVQLSINGQELHALDIPATANCDTLIISLIAEGQRSSKKLQLCQK